ncbi:MAG: protein containing prepilin-type N- cleavage/methylation domain protein, partial [Campylobacterales bacterium]|nr:protein containing prepilin-type N- cleavage/methylation domain protein [Campylobacterales bacterium]
WVGADVDGFRGDTKPYWSGVIDLDDSNATLLDTPETNTTAVNELIYILSNGSSDINDSAIYFLGSDTNIKTGYGWDGNITTINTQNGNMHPINPVSGQIDKLQPASGTSSFSGIDVYEYYQLAWSAYAIEHNATTKDLTLYYDYQPWQGDSYKDGKSSTLMQNVSTFRFKGVGSVVKIQVCVKTNLVEDYSLCKEKTVF